MQLGILILRLPYGLDFSDVLEEEEGPIPQDPTTNGGPPDIGARNTQHQQGQLAQGERP